MDSLGDVLCFGRYFEEFGGEYNCRARTSTATTVAAAPAFVVPQKLHTQQPRVRPMREAKKGNNMEEISGTQRYTESLQNLHLAEANKHKLHRESLIHEAASLSQ